MNYEVELDEIVSERMRDEIEKVVLTAYKGLVDLGYIKRYGEGCVTARKAVVSHIFNAIGDHLDDIKDVKLSDWVFKESHISEENISGYGYKIIQERKRELLRDIVNKL